MKTKTFWATDCGPQLDQAVNDFIKDKQVLDFKISTNIYPKSINHDTNSTNYSIVTTVMVVYQS